MTCPHCGAAVPAGSEVCPVCQNVLWPDGAPTTRIPAPPPPGPGNPASGYYAPPAPPGYSAPNPYTAPPAGYPPPGYPAPGASPPGYAPADWSTHAGSPLMNVPPPLPYGAVPPGYTYSAAPPAVGAAGPRQTNPGLLWSGVGLLIVGLFLCLCFGLIVAFAGQDPSNSAEEIRNTQLGGAICALGVLFVLGVPGGLLVFFGLRPTNR